MLEFVVSYDPRERIYIIVNNNVVHTETSWLEAKLYVETLMDELAREAARAKRPH